MQPNTPDGFVDGQSATYLCTPGEPNCDVGAVGSGAAGVPTGTAEPRGNVRVSGGADIAFVNCTFTALGAPYALSIMEGSQRPHVSGVSLRLWGPITC